MQHHFYIAIGTESRVIILRQKQPYRFEDFVQSCIFITVSLPTTVKNNVDYDNIIETFVGHALENHNRYPDKGFSLKIEKYFKVLNLIVFEIT